MIEQHPLYVVGQTPVHSRVINTTLISMVSDGVRSEHLQDAHLAGKINEMYTWELD